MSTVDLRATLVPVNWDGTELNPGPRDDGLLAIVTNVIGWYGTPAINGNDLERALTDGAIYGPKVLAARAIAIEGAVNGPRDLCLEFSRRLAALAAAREPADFAVGENGAMLVTAVRASTEQLTHEWRGPQLFYYTVTVTAADPRLYETGWRTAVLRFAPGEATGRIYPRTYPWRYAAAQIPTTARMENPGNAASPVWALYSGPLGETRLTDGVRQIRVGPLVDGEQILLNCETLVATAAGGATRASYILPGSVPMFVPAESEPTWRIYGTGGGSVALQWRGAFI